LVETGKSDDESMVILAAVINKNAPMSAELLHRRLGHLGNTTLIEMNQNQMHKTFYMLMFALLSMKFYLRKR